MTCTLWPELYCVVGALQLYFMTQQDEDRQRLMRLPGAAEGWPLEDSLGKGGTFSAPAWHTYVTDAGANADYPVRVLEATLRENDERVKR